MGDSHRGIKMPTGKIGPNTVRRILPWVEQYWHANKRYPTAATFIDHFSSPSLPLTLLDYERIHASKFYLNCLKDRGIISDPSSTFTELQQAAISLVTNVHDTRSNRAKLEAIGVTATMYNGWMQDATFYTEIQRRVEDVMEHIYPDAQAALAKQIKNGNVPALKFYYELTGRAQSPEMANVKVMMNRVIEAVQKHVKDPAVLQLIANEIIEAQRASVAQYAIENPSLPAEKPTSLKEQYKEHLKSNVI